MENIRLTSDHHFGHTNITRYDERPYGSVEEMDADMIARWNETVAPKDSVYHLGDIFLYKRVEEARLFHPRQPRGDLRPRLFDGLKKRRAVTRTRRAD